MQLRGLWPGTVRSVSPSIAAWLIVEGFAEPEMRRNYSNRDDETGFSGVKDVRATASDFPRRRRDD